MLRIADFEPVVEKVAVRVEPWEGRLLVSGGRLVLVNDCLTNIPMYMMGFYLFQDEVHEKLEFDPGSFGKRSRASKVGQ